MTALNAFGYLLNYCNCGLGYDPEITHITQERCQKACKLILDSPDKRFYWCRTTDDVLKEIHWPEVY